MLRVLLVDDEPMALEGLRLLIPWDREGFEVCAQCAGAAEALAQMALQNPDLVVTDIRMPGMDGLALMATARERGYQGQFVVVSGYGDFEYAQQALRIGVSGYLLKPVEPDEAGDVLEHVRRMLVNHEAGASEHKAEVHRALTALLCGQPLLPGKLPTGESWRLGTWGAPLPFETVRGILATFPEGAASAHIVEAREYLAVHWPAGEREPAWAGAEAWLSREGRALTQSVCISDATGLPALRQRLAALLDEHIPNLPGYLDAVCQAVALRQPEEFRKLCAQLCALCNACGADAKASAKRQLIAGCARQLADRPAALQQLLAAQDSSLETLGLLAIRLLAPTQERISDRVAEYVASRFAQRLTLENVADALGYNPTYLGRVFRDEQGQSFRVWLGNHRMEAAAGLLKTTDQTVCTVAEQVGYGQYKRFLAHFKHRYGVTPEQFRKK